MMDQCLEQWGSKERFGRGGVRVGIIYEVLFVYNVCIFFLRMNYLFCCFGYNSYSVRFLRLFCDIFFFC